VAHGVPESFAARIAHRGVRVRSIAEGRYTFELTADMTPEAFIAELSGAGGSLASVTALRTTLEDVFMETVRDRVLYGIGAFALLLVAGTIAIGQITAGQDVKIIKDLGLATIEI